MTKIEKIKKGGENRDPPPQKINKKSLMTTMELNYITGAVPRRIFVLFRCH